MTGNKEGGTQMAVEKDLSKYFAKGFEFESQIITEGIFSNDGGFHHLGLKITDNGKSTTIDGIVVYGNVVVLIEAKNYSQLEGRYVNDFWYGKGRGRRFSIFSPLKQNQYHEKFFEIFMHRNNYNESNIEFKKYVVVPDSCELKVDKLSRGFIMHLTEFEIYKRKLRLEHGVANESIINLIREGV